MILTLVIRWSKSNSFFDISLKKIMVKGKRRIFSFSSYSSVLELSYMIVSDELRSFDNLLHVIFIESTISQHSIWLQLVSSSLQWRLPKFSIVFDGLSFSLRRHLRYEVDSQYTDWATHWMQKDNALSILRDSFLHYLSDNSLEVVCVSVLTFCRQSMQWGERTRKLSDLLRLRDGSGRADHRAPVWQEKLLTHIDPMSLQSERAFIF